jgi:hypothetical protein
MPNWVDGTAVGGCSFMIHVRHAAAAIASGLCETILITHGESGRSLVGRTRNVVAPTSLAGQFEQPYGPMGPPTFVHNPGIELYEDLWPDARAIGDGLGRAARMGGEEPARRLRLRRSSRPSASFDFVKQWRWRSGHGGLPDD